MDLTKPPAPLKAIAMVCKCATEHDERDKVIAYYCVKIDGKSKESSKFLSALLDNLDVMKQALKDDERISSELHGQSYIEEYAMKLFTFAFKRDEAADFGPATLKSYLTAGILMDVLSFFGEVPEEIVKARKYAKYKAVYIKKCLDSGEVPVAGPASEADKSAVPDLDSLAKFTPDAANPTPHSNPPPAAAAAGGSENDLDPEVSAKAIKNCKFAISALDYADRVTAIKNLEEALKLLKTK